MKESPDQIAWLEEQIYESYRTAGPGIRRNFGGGTEPTAEQFIRYWQPGTMACISTVSKEGSVHIAPLDPDLVNGKFYILTSADSQRLRDHRANRRCAICSWDKPASGRGVRAVIVYGLAKVLDDAAERWGTDALRETAMVTVEITPTRIYAVGLGD